MYTFSLLGLIAWSVGMFGTGWLWGNRDRL